MITVKEEDAYEGSLRDLAPDLTPLIDIVFILIVFLLLTANPVALTHLTVELPQNKESKLQEEAVKKSNVIELSSENAIIYNGNRLEDISILKQRLMDEGYGTTGADKELIIAVDKKNNVEVFLQVVSLMQEMSIANPKILIDK